MTGARPRTIFEEIWDAHVVERLGDGSCVLYIDRTCWTNSTAQAFAGSAALSSSLR